MKIQDHRSKTTFELLIVSNEKKVTIFKIIIILTIKNNQLKDVFILIISIILTFCFFIYPNLIF